MIACKAPLECDVFVAGGGIGGLMAAIGATEKGASVIVAEKANTWRSGCGATGNDHFLCYIPSVHGDDPSAYIKEMSESQLGAWSDMALVRKYVSECFNVVQTWDEWGISMRPHGNWEFNGHAKPEHLRIWLKYAGSNQKEVLTKVALKNGVKILNHHPFTEVIVNECGTITGAICLDVSEESPKLQVIRAKSVILATGEGNRMYGSKYMGNMFNIAHCPSSTCAGRAAAYKVGARLVNMDLINAKAGPKYFNRSGKGTWIGVYSDMDGKPLGPFVTKPSKEYGDLAGDVWREMFGMKHKVGEPVFMNCTEAEQEDLDYMVWGLQNEGNVCTLNHLRDEGFDFRRHMVEFDIYSPGLGGKGIDVSVNCETTVRGLYAVGDEVGNFRGDLGAAATFGRIGGWCAAEYSNERQLEAAEVSPIVEKAAHHYTDILSRESGTGYPTWKEVNIAIQQVMADYCGLEVRSENFMRTGLQHLRRIRAKAELMACEDVHNFVRCLEVENLGMIAELTILCALERKETRGKHNRPDYPFTNPMLNEKFVTVQQGQDGKAEIAWRKKNK